MTTMQTKRAQYVADFCKAVGCTEDEARAYLEADDWLYFDAFTTFRLDQLVMNDPVDLV